MTDQLVDQIRTHAAAEQVPDLDLTGVLRRGRQARRRRSLTQRGIAVAAVGLVAATAVVGANRGNDDLRLDASTSITASDVGLVSAAYRSGGAFSRGDTLWFSDPEYAVDLGVEIQLMYYTADGVVAGVTNDNAGDVKRDYVYVGTDGSVRELHLPGKVVPGADAQADRFAYLTQAGTGYTIHVVEASTGRELATQPFDAAYTWAGWDVPPIGLTGDFVVLGVDDAQQVINWRTGDRVADVPVGQLPSTGGGRALGGGNGETVYQLGDSTPLRSTKDLEVFDEFDRAHEHPSAWNTLSPDGRFVLTTNTMLSYDEDGRFLGVIAGPGSAEVIKDPVVYLTDVATGHRITLPGHSRTYGWTPDGQVMRVDGTQITTCESATGDCTTRTMPAGSGTIRMAGKYLGS